MSPKLLNFLLVLVPVVLYPGYVDPMYNGGQGLVWTPESNIFVLKAKNLQYANALDQISFVNTEVEKLNKDYLSINKDVLEKVGFMLPDSIDSIKIRNEIVSIGNDSGVAISSLSVTEGCKGQILSGLGCYSVSFSVRTHYSVFKLLTENIEKSMRFYIVDSVGIQRRSDNKQDPGSKVAEEDPEMLNINLSLRLYYLK